MISVLTPTIRPEGLNIVKKGLSEQTFTDFEWLVEIGLPNKGHDLNAAYNRMLKRAKGELIVSLQDYIKIDTDYLEKFWVAYCNDKRMFLTAPVGKVDSLDFTGNVKWDWRYHTPNTRWDKWEIDSAAAPLSALKEIGGFDESLDGHWSADNVNVACRADLAGYKFLNLVSNKSLAYDHDALIEHPFRKLYDPSFNNERMNAFRSGLKIDYLTPT